MPGPIFDELAATWHHAEHELAGDIANLFHHGRYHDPGTSTVPKETQETPMDLAQLEQDMRNDVQAATDKVAEVWNHLKTVGEQHVPAIVGELQRLQGSTVVKALEAAVLTPAEEVVVAHFIADLPSLRITTTQSAESPSEPSGQPDQPATPADPPQPVSVGPVVGGTAT